MATIAASGRITRMEGTMTVDDQLVSFEALRELADEFDDDCVCRSFVGNFISMWEARHARLRDAVLACDVKAAMDAVLSVKTASAMAGAKPLSALAAKLQQLIQCLGEELRTSSTLALLEEIKFCGEATIVQLKLWYSGSAGPAGR
jgi:HPt (histidine-containing phosphotransfer) domain-containing protein